MIEFVRIQGVQTTNCNLNVHSKSFLSAACCETQRTVWSIQYSRFLTRDFSAASKTSLFTTSQFMASITILTKL